MSDTLTLEHILRARELFEKEELAQWERLRKPCPIYMWPHQFDEYNKLLRERGAPEMEWNKEYVFYGQRIIPTKVRIIR